MPYHGEAAASAKASAASFGKALGGIGIVGAVADVIEGSGLDKAEAAAGDVLRPLFGGSVPWEMSVSEIVDAVVPNFLPDVIPGAAEAASSGAAIATDVLLTVV